MRRARPRSSAFGSNPSSDGRRVPLPPPPEKCGSSRRGGPSEPYIAALSGRRAPPPLPLPPLLLLPPRGADPGRGRDTSSTSFPPTLPGARFSASPSSSSSSSSSVPGAGAGGLPPPARSVSDDMWYRSSSGPPCRPAPWTYPPPSPPPRKNAGPELAVDGRRGEALVLNRSTMCAASFLVRRITGPADVSNSIARWACKVAWRRRVRS